MAGPSRFSLSVAGRPDPLPVAEIEGREHISRLFEVRLMITSDDAEIDFASMLDQPALLTMLGSGEPRHVHGVIHRFQQAESGKQLTVYEAALVPSVFRLSQRRDSRIFQVLTVPEILEQVLQAAGFAADAYRFMIYRKHWPKEYSVQYRETDWDYISRLMEEEGIFSFFEHTEGADVLVIADAPFAYAPIAAPDTLGYHPSGGVMIHSDHIHRLRYTEEVRSGKVTLRDFNFKTPALSLEVSAEADQHTDREIYDYPGEYDLPKDGAERAKSRLEDLQAYRLYADGDSNCARLAPGHTFVLSDHPREAFNQAYLVTEVEHRGKEAIGAESAGDDSGGYTNRFRVIPANVPYRPAERTPKPTARGVQTAIVVGPAGEEIYTDEYGRVKVQFHWDRQGKRDEHSSCWIRVSQVWAGQAYGAVYLPRIGHEVIVDFLEGDPDRPIIVGRVYHGTNVPPYALPGEKTKSTLKSNTSPGGAGSNEFRFEDQKGLEEIYLHGQRDWNIHIEHDKDQVIGRNESLHVGNDRMKKVVVNQSEDVGANKTIRVGSNHTETIGSDESVTVGKDSTRLIGAKLDEQIGSDKTVSVGGNHKESISGNMTLKVAGESIETVGTDRSLEVGGNYSITTKGNMTIAVSGDSEEDVSGEKRITSLQKIVMKTGESVISFKADGTMTIECKDLSLSASGDVKIEADGKVSVKAGGPVEVKGADVKIKGGSIDMN
jgi:type VI secretion system secreted protein VgrG